MSERTPCCVPYCAKSVKGLWAEWLCRDHYAMVDAALKKVRARIKRRMNRRGEIEKVGKNGWRPSSERAARADNGVWRRMKRQATERAMGISG